MILACFCGAVIQSEAVILICPKCGKSVPGMVR
jgi:predicted RNA-binding Zn-ribbon protein involved in translation (DUF1610 family)